MSNTILPISPIVEASETPTFLRDFRAKNIPRPADTKTNGGNSPIKRIDTPIMINEMSANWSSPSSIPLDRLLIFCFGNEITLSLVSSNFRLAITFLTRVKFLVLRVESFRFALSNAKTFGSKIGRVSDWSTSLFDVSGSLIENSEAVRCLLRLGKWNPFETGYKFKIF